MPPHDLLTAAPVRRRAYVLGLIAATLLLLAAGWAMVEASGAYSALNDRAAINPVDAVPPVLRGAASMALLWALALVLLSLRLLASPAGPSPAPTGAGPVDGMTQRIALVLLAVSATTTVGIHPTSAHASTVVSTVSDTGHGRMPVPGFGAPPAQVLRSTPEPSFAARSSLPPSPGWTAPAPARTRSAGSASAPLVTGCAGRADDSADEPEIVVRRGDSLWILVARHLQTEDPASIAAEWPRWYAVNRDVIGPDPDLLSVGQILQLPSPIPDSPTLQGLPQ